MGGSVEKMQKKKEVILPDSTESRKALDAFRGMVESVRTDHSWSVPVLRITGSPAVIQGLEVYLQALKK